MPVHSAVEEDKTVKTEELEEKGPTQPFLKTKFYMDYTQFGDYRSKTHKMLLSEQCPTSTAGLQLEKNDALNAKYRHRLY